ncbi:MAG: NADH-quinone oxidoreductase subunit L, partial [Gammaproteobacteria bacterium]|nr:NADH-quinone oxidoreductase subunit L [Gammaproteobacteria bacterium]
MPAIYVWIVLLPLLASIFAGLVGPFIDRRWAHRVTIAGVGLSAILSYRVFADIVLGDGQPFDGLLYTWGQVGGLTLGIGFLVDQLTATMMIVVTFVSLMVHVYTIGYMHDDPGYQRF